MIKVQDWMASIPDGEKHIAYVGEAMSETREFFLCGEGWESYADWSFHLDMAFDPESITTRDSRQVVQIHTSSTETAGEETVDLSKTVTQETYTVEKEAVLSYDLTDVAPLEKRVTDNGVHLTWTVLRQHTLLPGKLWATLRAVDSTAQRIKKSAIMVFEVDASVAAVPAARPAISEMEQIEARVAAAADRATADADRAEAAAASVEVYATDCQENAEIALESKEKAAVYAGQAEQMYNLAVGQVSEAAQAKWAAQEAADSAAEHAAQAQQYSAASSDCAAEAATAVTEAEQAAASAVLTAEGCRQNAAAAVERCSRYAVQCENYALQAQGTLAALDNLIVRQVNVRDYGAVGDGVTDDRAAILAAFEAAKLMLPCEVYFPAGTYGISNGMYIRMPLGSGGLRVRGAGRDVTTIQYLDSFPDSGQVWYALAIKPEATPANEEEYLHDIGIVGLTIHDPDPCAKAWHLAKGDPGQEETHGFGLDYVKRCSVTDCQVVTAGDESINIFSCHDAIVANNHLFGCPGAGPGGGGIAICDGSVGVVVIGNTINGSALDETLEDGTVIEKHNTGIEVESMGVPVRDVVIANNTIRYIQGTGIGMYAGSEGCAVYNVTISNNVITGCNVGIDDSGNFEKKGILISNNNISDCAKLHNDNGRGVYLSAATFDVAVLDNIIANTEATGIYVCCSDGDAVIEGNTLKNIGTVAVFVDGGAYIKDCTIINTGMSDSASLAAVAGYGTSLLRVYGCRITGVRQMRGISGATEVEDTTIEMVDAEGNPVTDGQVLSGTSLKRLINCRLGGYITIAQPNAVVQGVTLTCSQQWQPAIKVSASGVMVSGCQISHTNGNDCIRETGSGDGNLFVNNVVDRDITTVGVHTIAVNNLDTRATA